MAHSVTRVFVHYVWTTRSRERVLLGGARKQVEEHLRIYAAQNSVCVEALSIQFEHVHLLAQLLRSQRIEDITKLLKGESSHWINAQDLLKGKFAWQTGYWAGSVCYQHKDLVRSYIENQDGHHQRKTFIEEFEETLHAYGYSQAEIAEMLRLQNR